MWIGLKGQKAETVRRPLQWSRLELIRPDMEQ